MPKLILAAAVLLLGKPSPARTDGMHSAMHAKTRSRDSTRRLRALGPHTPNFDLGALDLTRRH